MQPLPDPGERQEQDSQQQRYLSIRNGYKRQLTANDAVNVHNLIRMYPTATPNVVAGVAVSQVKWDAPMLRDIMERDAAQFGNHGLFRTGSQSMVERGMGDFMSTVRGGVRGAMVAAETPWQELVRVQRAGVRTFQGQSPVDAWRSASPSVGSRAMANLTRGEDVRIGTGFIPGGGEVQDNPEYGTQIMQGLQQGNTLADSVASAEQNVEAKLGKNLWEQYDEVAESTLMTKTVDGVNYRSPVSPGRMVAISVSHPGTMPFQALSAAVDFTARITVDPIDVPIYEFAMAKAAKSHIVSNQARGAIREAELQWLDEHLGVKTKDLNTNSSNFRTHGQATPTRAGGYEEAEEAFRRNPNMSPDEYKQILANPEGSREINLDLGSISDFALDTAGKRPSQRTLGGTWRAEDVATSPYAAGYEELDRITQELHGMNFNEYMFTKYGDEFNQKVDEVLMHEIVHADLQWDEQVARLRQAGVPEGEIRKIVGQDADYWGKIGPEASEWRARRVEILEEQRTMRVERMNDRDAAQMKVTLIEEEMAWQTGLVETIDGDIIPSSASADDIDKTYAQLREAYDDLNKKQALLTLSEEAESAAAKMSTVGQAAEYDAVVTSGKRLLAGESAMRDARKFALREAGLTDSWRPWIKPQMVEDYLTSEKGQNVIRFLSKNKSLAQQRKIIKDLPVTVQMRLIDANTEAEVIDLLSRFLGSRIQGAPTLGAFQDVNRAGARGSRVVTQPGASAADTPISRVEFPNGKIAGNVQSGLHRMGAKAVKMELDPSDIEKSMDHAEAWLRTVRATDSEVDKVLTSILKATEKGEMEGVMPNLTGAYDEMQDIFIRALAAELGDSRNADAIITAAVKDFQQATINNVEYWVDAAGNKIDDVDSVFQTMWNPVQGQRSAIPKFSAVLESQTAMTKLTLPNGREVRRATSGLHLRTQRFFEVIKNGVGDDTTTAKILDVLYPEGLNDAWGIRMADATHQLWRDMALLRIGWPLRVLPEELLRQAASGYSDFVTHPISYLGLMLRKHMQGGAFGDSLDDLASLEALGAGRFRGDALRWDATKQSWTVVQPGQKGYREGLGSSVLQLNRDPVARKIAELGLEEAKYWLETAEGLDAARQVTFKGQGSALLDLSTQAGREKYAERAHAMMAQLTGGSWIRKNANGRWVDMFGNEVTDWAKMTREEIVQRINLERSKKGLESVNARATSYPKQHWIDMAAEETGIPKLSGLDEDAAYIVTKAGDENLTRLIARGENLDGNIIIKDDMRVRSRSDYDMGDFATELEEMYGTLGVDLPTSVRTPREALTIGAEGYNTVIDTVFETLMAKPSAYLIRSPYFKQKYSEEMAKAYIFGNADVRRHLKKWASDNGVTPMFNRHIRAQTEKVGLVRPPKASFGGWDMDDLKELDDLAKSRSLKASRDLFYDLSERNNVADMTKHIFPFADAWFEVLSRWAKLLFASPERSLKNWRRFQVGVTNARKEGFFTEDEYGREVFNWPGAGLLAPALTGAPIDQAIESKAGLDQLMFIDPNPRGILMPGVGPIMQIPASAVTPKLEEFPVLRDAINWFAFGDFEKIEPQNVGDMMMAFAPSWMRQAASAFMGQEHRREFGDDVGQLYETLLMSGDAKYGDDSMEQMRRTLAQAQSTGTALSWLKIVDRFVLPATGRYRPSTLIEAAGSTEPFWITSMALSDEYRAAREMLGEDNDAANKYMIERFGINPLNLASNSYLISDAPVTKTAYDFLQTNEEISTHAPLTMMAWIDVPSDDEFYSPAWQRQIANGQRINVTPEQRAWMINEQKGWAEWEVVKAKSDEYLAIIRDTTDERSPERAEMNAAVNQWRNERSAEIFETYWAWDNQQKRHSDLPQKPTPVMLWDEMIDAGTVGSAANDYLKSVDPDMARFMESFARKTKLMRDYSLQLSVRDEEVTSSSMNWWLESTTPEAEALREGFVSFVKTELLRLPLDKEPRGKYILRRYILPVFDDFEYDDELWLTPVEFELPELPPWGTRETDRAAGTPIGPGARLLEGASR